MITHHSGFDISFQPLRPFVRFLNGGLLLQDLLKDWLAAL
jgi:hypothetical protein